MRNLVRVTFCKIREQEIAHDLVHQAAGCNAISLSNWKADVLPNREMRPKKELLEDRSKLRPRMGGFRILCLRKVDIFSVYLDRAGIRRLKQRKDT